MTGFVIFDYAERFPEGVEQLSKWLATGELRSHEHIVRGEVGDFPDTLRKLFAGENVGKLILALDDR
jgi:NADPH-dependent curcumin reductase CurA